MAVAADEDAVRSVVLDYVAGWFEGDAGRMKRALHPELVKRCRRIEIKIDYLSGGIASVQCFCHRYVDLLHLIDMPDGWKIVNAAWRLR
jgi:hypothetical protein